MPARIFYSGKKIDRNSINALHGSETGNQTLGIVVGEIFLKISVHYYGNVDSSSVE